MMTAATAVDHNIAHYNHMEMNSPKWTVEQHQLLAAGSGDDRMLSVYDQTHYLGDSCSEEDEDDTILVEQHLKPEQKDYEFPSRALLVELAAVLDTDPQDNNMFDESSFTTICDNDDDDVFDEYIGSIVSSIQQNQRRHYSPDGLHNTRSSSASISSRWSLVDDSRLSPLQLPPRDDDDISLYRQRSMERSDLGMQSSIPRPVHPSFFLRQENDADKIIHPDDADYDWDQLSLLSSTDSLDLPVFVSEAVPILDDDDTGDDDDDEYDDAGSFRSHARHPSKVVIRLNKKVVASFREAAVVYQGSRDRRRRSSRSIGAAAAAAAAATAASTPLLHHRRQISEATPWSQDDEGYNDESTAKDDEEADADDDEDDELESVSVFLPLTAGELADMADQNEMLRNAAARTIQACWRGYLARKKQKKGFVGLMSGLATICTRLHHRQMTRMTQRLETLQGRVEEERAMRIGFEKAMEEMAILIDKQQTMLYDRMEQMQVEYDQRIAAESQKRLALEESMNRVLLEMQDMQRQQQRRANEEAENTRALQKKLDLALQQLKKSTAPHLQQQQQQRSTTPSSSLLLSSSSVRTGSRRHPRTPTASILDRPSASPLRSTLTTQRRRA